MPANPIHKTIAKISGSRDSRDLQFIDHIRMMLDDDGTQYDWSQDDTDTLENALNCMAFVHLIRQKLNALGWPL